MKIRIFLKKIKNSFLHQLKLKDSTPISVLEIEKAEQIFYIQYLNPGMVVFDIGANIGDLSILFSHFVGQTGSVHSFEASPETFIRLKAIVEQADCSNIQLNCLAVSDHVGVSKLFEYDRLHSGWTTLANRPLQRYGIELKPIRVEQVNTITVDAYCETHGVEKIDLLKIDVEGAEYQVLRGAERMLNEGRIGCCVFEFGNTTFDMGNHPEQIKSFLDKCGYTIRNIIPKIPIFPGGHSVGTAEFSIHVCTRIE